MLVSLKFGYIHKKFTYVSPFVHSVRGLGLCDRVVKEDKELFEGGLVHDVDLAELHDEEVEDAAPGGYRSELFPGRVYL